MGDVLTLIEKAEQAVEEDEQAEMERRLLTGQFTSTTSSPPRGCSRRWAR